MIRIGRPIIKAWSLVGYGPAGAQVFRNPPPQVFRPEHEHDIPAFAHDGVGNVLPGQWGIGEHGDMVWNTNYGEFRHGIDAVAKHLGDFLRARGINVPAKDVINEAINEFNDTHTNGDEHALTPFESREWRKIRGNALPPGDATRDTTTRPSRTQGGTKITMLTNKNHEETPMGRFLESYYIPFNKQLMHQLTDMGIPESEIKQALPFTKYPYMYAHLTAPQGYIRSHAKQHGSEVDAGMMGQAPEGYFGDTEAVHTWEVTHHLPDIFFYPNVKENLQKKGKAATGLEKSAHAMIEQALQQGLEHIPNIEATVNTGTLASPQMITRPLHEILQTPDLRNALIKDMSNVPAMMFLFGRSGQGDFKRLYDHMMTKYGADAEMLSPEEQAKYLTAGEKGGKGMHESAKRLFALARASGEGKEEGRSRFGEHSISADELNAIGMHHSDQLMNQVGRFRGIIEALADHQASARGNEVKRGLGDVPTTARPAMTIGGYPQMDAVTGQYSTTPLDPHMDAYIHDIHDFAPTQAFDPTQTLSPVQQVSSPSPVASPAGGLATSLPPTPAPPVRATPTSYPHSPIQQFQQIRPQIGQFSPSEFRQMLEMAGRRRPQPITDAPLTEVEQRAQQSFADPQQTILPQFIKSKNSVMDDVMRIIRGGRQ